jgi:hypothetical protein
MKYTFICEHYRGTNDRPIGRVTVETERPGIVEVIEAFEDFLRGCGHYIGPNKHLELIN